VNYKFTNPVVPLMLLRASAGVLSFLRLPALILTAVRQAPFIRFFIPILIAVISAGIGIGASEVASRVIVDHVAVHSYSVTRNPFKDRFWLVYTQPEPRRTDKLIVVITNSQGSLLEGRGEDCYAARLQAHLNATDTKHTYTVANWALPGSNAGELVLLAARAVDHHPDAIILSSFSNNFGAEHTKFPLSFARNDVEQLGYLPSVRSRLSPKFIKHFKVNRRRGKLAAYSSLLNLHESVAFWIRDPRSKEDRDWSRILNKPPIQSEPVTDTGRRMIEEIHNVLHKALPETPVLVVNMPLGRTKIVPESWRNTDDFLVESERIFTEPQFKVMDAREIAAPERFYTATHMDPQGHDLYARYLLPEVLKYTAKNEL